MIVRTNLDFGKESAESEQPFLRRVFLPTRVFARISREHNIPEADVRLEILAIGEQSWAIELKYRNVQSSDLHHAAYHAVAAKAKSGDCEAHLRSPRRCLQ